MFIPARSLIVPKLKDRALEEKIQTKVGQFFFRGNRVTIFQYYPLSITITCMYNCIKQVDLPYPTDVVNTNNT